MRKFLFFAVSLITVLLLSCDSTQTSFDDTVPELFTLTITVSPEESGNVVPSGGEFVNNSFVTLEAIPAPGFRFERWGGDLTSSVNPDSLRITKNSTITAFFTEGELPLNITIVGQGQVTREILSQTPSQPTDIETGAPGIKNPTSSENNDATIEDGISQDGNQISILGNISDSITDSGRKIKVAQPAVQAMQTDVRLTAVPDSGWVFSRWEGDLTGNQNPVDITVEDETNITAVFEEEEPELFTLNIQVQGNGVVNLDPDQTEFEAATVVTLTAVPDVGWEFVEWQGDITSTENPESLLIDSNKNVTARFAEPGAPVLSILQQPSGTTAGNTIQPAPRALILDGLDNPVEGASVSVSLNKNSFGDNSSTTATTDSEGIATFDNLSVLRADSDYTITFNADLPDIPEITSVLFNILPAEPEPGNTTAIVPDGVAGEPTNILINVSDSFENPVPGAANLITVTVNGANSEQPEVTETDSDGEYIATYTPVNAGNDQIDITLNDIAINGSPFTSQITTSDVSSSNSTVTVDPSEVEAGNSTVLTVTIRDEQNNTISGLAGSIQLSGLGNATAGTITESGNSGIYTTEITNNVAETLTVSVIADGVTLSETAEITFLPGDPSSLTLVSGNNQTANVGQTLSEPFVVKITDSFENPVPGQAIDFTITEMPEGATGQALSESTVNTNAGGEASVTLTLGDKPGTYSVSAVAAAVSAGVTFTATAQSGQASQLTITQQPTTTVAGESLSPAPSVKLTDSFDNPIGRVEINVSLNGTQLTAGSTTSVTTDGNGDAIFNNLVIETAGTDFELVFNSGINGIDPVVSNQFDVVPASVQPSNSSATVPNGVAGETTTIQIQLFDAFDNPVSNAEDNINITVSGANTASPTASASAGPGEYTASYIPTNSGTDNIAINFDGTPINGSPFTSEVVTSDISSSISSVNANPETVTVGSNSIVTVRLRDSNNNSIAGLSDSDFSINVTGDAENGNVNEVSSGNYEFTVTNETAEQITVTVTVTGVQLQDTPQITFTAGSADLMIITQQPEDTEAGSSIEGLPTVRITDEFGNRVSGFDVSVREQGGQEFDSGSLIQPTNSIGEAVFNDLIINEAGDYNLVFSGNGLANVTSNLFTINSANPDPANTTANVPNGSAGDPTQFSITVSDAFGNRVEGVASLLNVEVTGQNGGAAVETITDEGNGIYTTGYTPIRNGVDNVVIELNGIEIAGSPFSSTVTTSDAANIEMIQQPAQTTAGQAINGPPAVRVTDDLGNEVSGVEVTVSEQGGLSFNSGTLTVSTDNNGEAQFGNLVINIAGSYTLVFDAVGVSDNAVSQSFDITPAAGDPSESFANVPNGIAGSETEITITIEDQFGNRVDNSGSDISLSVSGANAGASFSSLSDAGNGVYTTSYTPVNSGTDQISIRLDGSGISGSPFTSNVGAGSIADYRISNIDSPQVAGSSFSVTITAIDTNGNTATGYNGSADLSTNAGSISPSSVNFSGGVANPDVTVTEAGLSKSITATDSQNSSITETSNSFTVLPGPISSSVSTVSASPTTLTAGSSSTVTVSLRDANGNLIGGLGSGDFVISLSGSATIDTPISETSTGIYEFAVTDNTAESVDVTVSANGVELGDNPTITFQAGSADSFSFDPIGSPQTAGQNFSITITALDAAGNTATGYNDTATLSTTAGTISPAEATFSGGLATLSVSVTEAGTGQTITATDNTITGTSNTFEIEPGAADPANTTGSVQNGTVGSETTITITVQDQFGNPVSGVEEDLSITVTGANSATPNATESSTAGTYTANYTPTAAGEDSIEILLGLDEISNSPLTSTVSN